MEFDRTASSAIALAGEIPDEIRTVKSCISVGISLSNSSLKESSIELSFFLIKRVLPITTEINMIEGFKSSG
jgi:hypothetical protein